MNVLFLTNNMQIAKPLYEWLCAAEGYDNVKLWDAPLTKELFRSELQGVEFIISYNYRYIIKSGVLAIFPGRVINLHISMLPWNRGASPNLWSFIDDTPKGVTIHFVDKGIDTGDILCQKQVFFDEETETLASSYEKLHAAIHKLFKESWDCIKSGMITPKKQGSFHTQRESDDIMSKLRLGWECRVSHLKNVVATTKINEKRYNHNWTGE